MFEISTIEVDNQKENTIFKRSINLDKNLDCFFMISSSSNSLAENLLNHTLESIVDKISKEETYNDFGIALENINSFLKTWRTDQEEEDEVDMIISILNENNLMFSNIGKSTVYLINKNNEIIELTERNENKKSFLFISSGILANSEIIISSTLNVLKYLSKSDILDGMILSNDIEIFNRNIKNILQSEIVDKNCIISSMKYKNEFITPEENPKILAVKDFAIKILDTDISKKIISKTLLVKEKISNQNKTVRNFLFLGLIVILILILFALVSGFLNITTQNNVKQEAENQINQVNFYIEEAQKNVSNPGFFNNSIEQAEELIKTLESKKLYENDLKKAQNEINILKKQFNKIEIFSASANNLIYSENNETSKRVVKSAGKTYIIIKNGIVGPIVSGSKPKTTIFNSLAENEEFIDAGILGQDVYLLTNTSKIVKFNKNGVFSFSSVSGQQAWEEMKNFDTYLSRVYTLGKDNQIYKHEATSATFGKGVPMLKEEDLKSLGEIISMSIDGGFYIVKKDLSIVKFYSNPYKLTSLSVNKYPKNYTLEEGKRFEIKSGVSLNYVYMYLNDKIFVFQPNSNDFKSTRSLTYIGQIEGGDEKILDFYVEKDGEIIILNKKGLFKLNFEVSNEKLILK